MKVIVFGGAGFIGGHVADNLSESGFDVTIFDQNTYPYLRSEQKYIKGSILNYEEVLGAVADNDYVYNFAAIADTDEAVKKPLTTIEINVMGNAKILDACVVSKVKRFVFASSVYVYSELAPFYRSSKQACELMIEDYNKVYGLNYTILRYGSLYGKRANSFNFIYKIIQQAIEEGKITRHGDGEEIRDYINVLDAARCSVEILYEEYKNHYVMLTGTQSTKVRDILNMIKEIFHDKIEIEYIPTKLAGHYEITPYSFRPRVAKKLISHYYYDLGQGILDIIYDVYSRMDKTDVDLNHIKKQIDPF
ncbi:MAG: NAD(P)-dependent oxidoreductase [Nitrospirae bacterium]|nr:NAD(P)-dependent oxidoreductase [Nitrospirota bacterium]